MPPVQWMQWVKRARRWLWTLPAALFLAGLGWALSRAGLAALPEADFTFNNNSEVSTLDPAAVSSIPEGRILRALYEGLVIRDPLDLSILPGAAESWEVSPDGLSWTFRLRPGLTWSNGDPLTASDFAFSFQRLLLPTTASPFASFLFPVVGARDFHGGSGDWDSVGIKTPNALVLRLELESPRSYFLHLLASTALLPVHARSLQEITRLHPENWTARWLAPGNLVTNGPYTLELRRINDRIRLRKNPRYWDEAQVAFGLIDALAVEHWGTALNLYLTGGCDWLDGSVPPLYARKLLGREDFRPSESPYLGLYFYRLNCSRPPLDNVRVRQALALTANREAVCNQLLGIGQEPCTSFVPWGRLGDYVSPMQDLSNLPGARRLLASAGLPPETLGAPLVIHYNTAESHRDIAEILADTWKSALGLDIRFANQEWKVWLDSQNHLDYQISRSSWIADYPDASSFLSIFTSDNPNNRTGWKNAAFDELIARSERELDAKKRNRLLAAAERILIEEVPAIPIYSYVAQNVVNPRLGGFHGNLLNEQNPKFWYWKSDDELWQERRLRVGSLESVPARGPKAGLYPKGSRRGGGR